MLCSTKSLKHFECLSTLMHFSGAKCISNDLKATGDMKFFYPPL